MLIFLLGIIIHLREFHKPYLIRIALISFSGVNYLGAASVRGFFTVMDSFCILNSHVWSVGTGSLHHHLLKSKQMNMGYHTDTHGHTNKKWVTQRGQMLQQSLVSTYSTIRLKVISVWYIQVWHRTLSTPGIGPGRRDGGVLSEKPITFILKSTF